MMSCNFRVNGLLTFTASHKTHNFPLLYINKMRATVYVYKIMMSDPCGIKRPYGHGSENANNISQRGSKLILDLK